MKQDNILQQDTAAQLRAQFSLQFYQMQAHVIAIGYVARKMGRPVTLTNAKATLIDLDDTARENITRIRLQRLELHSNADAVREALKWYAEYLAAAAAPTEEQQTAASTCQICGRAIKSEKAGKIAHHGYKRPGNGWQTASCMGAQYAPYEQSADRIPTVIERYNALLKESKNNLAQLLNSPPAVIKTRKHNRGELIEIERPADFDPSTTRRTYHPYAYDTVYFHQQHQIEQDISSLERELDYLSNRLANWKAPVKKDA